MSFPPIVCQLILLVIVITAAVYDGRVRRIPNWLVLTGLVLGMALNTFLAALDPFQHWWQGLLFSLKGLGLAFLIYFPLYLLRGMGAGDVKLMAAVGSIVGWANWLFIFFLTAILGGVAAIVILLSRKQLAHGLSNTGYLLFELLSFRPPYARNEAFDVTSGKSMKLPHGVVIAWGSVLFLAVVWLWAPR